MRDYWLTQSLLQAVGWGYVLAVVIALLLAGWAPRRGKVKVLAVLAVLVVASILPIKGYRQYREQQQIVQERKERYQKALALFQERCKTAEETIYQTAGGVRNILLLNVRSDRVDKDYFDANWADAALPNQFGGKEYVLGFLKSWRIERFQGNGSKKADDKSRDLDSYSYHGYDSVDIKQADGVLYRYRLKDDQLVKTPMQGDVARYSVSHENISDPVGREYWIAGTTVIITDTKNDRVMAKKTWYSFERGLGNRSGERMPWLFAVSCPEQRGHESRYPTHIFVRKVLKD
ncbi:hypothetical protein [Paracidovorax cattleyae]|uniref:Uncharacterized protein n=1 Tax=Paracidovorax cattleyae TaxID=80868 RepID=A0A1H0WTR5_9BURK|nr:hypothetical protein [Paracidovorax cattleyae]MBF9263950.1 hypothetical protein [Paracidovorax cattleyae]SDP94107.1 hypothetical protein SAMN04489708_15810 [Paracidovorax cattleyae]